MPLLSGARTMMKIYGDTNSGNCLKVKWVCDHLALPYNWIGIDIDEGRDPHRTNFSSSTARGRCRSSNSTTAVRWRSPTPSFDIWRAAATSFPPILLPRRKWMNGCSGNNTATSPISRSAASRWSILASPRPISIRTKVKRGYAALARMEHQLAATRFLVGDRVSLADVALLAYTRAAHEGGFHLDGYAAVRRWIGETEKALGLSPAR